MGQLDNKVAFVTGGAAGIGEQVSRMLASEGAKVMVTDMDGAKAAEVAESIGAQAESTTLDVTSEEQWEAAIAKALETFGKLNVMVNNAGISEPGTIQDETLEHWQRVLDINLNGAFLGTKHAVNAMKDNGEDCSIVNIGSMLAVRPGAFVVAYCASKAGVRAMTKASALHCANSGYKIRCNLVHPGAIETPMLERYMEMTGLERDAAYQSFAENHPMGRCGKPEEIAKAVLFLASDASSFTTGTDLTVDGGGFIRE